MKHVLMMLVATALLIGVGAQAYDSPLCEKNPKLKKLALDAARNFQIAQREDATSIKGLLRVRVGNIEAGTSDSCDMMWSYQVLGLPVPEIGVESPFCGVILEFDGSSDGRNPRGVYLRRFARIARAFGESVTRWDDNGEAHLIDVCAKLAR